MKAFLKGEPYENLEIEVINRLYPNSTDSSDKNFLKVRLTANVHGFNTSFLCNVRTDEITYWIDKIDNFIHGKTLQIKFGNMEENIIIECVSDLSHIQWTCRIKSEGKNSPVLSFKIETPITAAEELQKGFKNIITEYPVLGLV
jgi:hypothetical protein